MITNISRDIYENKISGNGGTKLHKNCMWYTCELSKSGLTLFLANENMGVQTIIIWVGIILDKIFMKFKFPVMAELICIKTICAKHANGRKMVSKCSLPMKIWV